MGVQGCWVCPTSVVEWEFDLLLWSWAISPPHELVFRCELELDSKFIFLSWYHSRAPGFETHSRQLFKKSIHVLAHEKELSAHLSRRLGDKWQDFHRVGSKNESVLPRIWAWNLKVNFEPLNHQVNLYLFVQEILICINTQF